MNNNYDNTTQKVWLVNESDPWPDQYIAIIFGDEETLNETIKTQSTVCYELDEALNHARALQEKFELKQTRIFYPNKVSIIIHSKKKEQFKFYLE